MPNYVYPQPTFEKFSVKDGRITGDPLKIIKGFDFDQEFDALTSSSASKLETFNPTFTGTMNGGIIGGTTTIDCGTFAP